MKGCRNCKYVIEDDWHDYVCGKADSEYCGRMLSDDFVCEHWSMKHRGIIVKEAINLRNWGIKKNNEGRYYLFGSAEGKEKSTSSITMVVHSVRDSGFYFYSINSIYYCVSREFNEDSEFSIHELIDKH